jgi:hypothetical protein
MVTKLGRLLCLANLVRRVGYPPFDKTELISPTRALLDEARPAVVPTYVLGARFRKLVKRDIFRVEDMAISAPRLENLPFGIPFLCRLLLRHNAICAGRQAPPKENATESFC